MDEIRNAPKPGAIPTSLYPDIQFLPLYHGGGENQRFSCLWSFMWSKPLLCRFRQSGEIPQTQVSQGFAAFRLAPSRIPPRHSQMSRATNCTTPGYLLVTIIARNSCDSKPFPVCGHLCGQSGFSVRFCQMRKSRKRPCCKGFRALAVSIVDRRRNAPKAGAIPPSLHPVIQFFIRLGVFSQASVLPTIQQ